MFNPSKSSANAAIFAANSSVEGSVLLLSRFTILRTAVPIPDASQRISYLNSKSKVELSDEQLALIAVQVDAIRNMIIQ